MKNKAHIRNPEGIWFRVFSYLKPYKKSFLFIGITLIISTVVGFLQPLVIRQITDEGMLQKDMAIIIQAAAYLAGLVTIDQLISLVQARIFADMHNDAQYRIFHQVFEKLLHLKKSYFEDKNNAEILSYLQMDVSQVSSVTDQYIVITVSYVFKIISGLIGLFIISWRLAFVVLAMVPIKFLLVKILSRRQEKAMEAMIEKSRDFSRWFGDNLGGIDEIKLWNLFKSKDKSFKEKQREVLRLQKRGTMISAYNTFFEILLEWSVTILLYILGDFLICSNALTIGAVFAFVSYSSYVTGPAAMMINIKMYLARIAPSAKRLFSFLDMQEERDFGKSQIDLINPPSIAFKNVAFSYTEERKILNGATFKMEPGEKVAIIGSNGSGKSTILNLLLRFYEPLDGTVLINGQAAGDIELEDYRALFSVVSQNPYLFLGNVRDNVDLICDADPARYNDALKASGADSFIARLPEHENTQIGQNGARLSGGEKQKLAVARALLKDAPVVILDEATSGFDVESDSYLHDVLLNNMEGKSVLMITHHYHNLEGMDKIYRLSGGTLEAVTIDQLMQPPK